MLTKMADSVEKRKKRSKWNKEDLLYPIIHILSAKSWDAILKFSQIHNLTNKYRDEKKIVGPSGGSPSTWEYYTKIYSILGSYKSCNLETFVEESAVYEVVECALSPNNSSIDSQEEFPPSVE
ncbi:uncharacterized protein LOC128920074 isoform X2 [Zeugodacus cucurbitae]|uniref:uncharacterized protein LOC128920074 isoform X2 n=1 Tax=Zeugodacus cucurbitae TaxID=28588 RepID=UPI0023D912A5|nr:uncharacterized protein LOC128920074 isoform X2 [Zeugodacus cucurbitae]